MTGRVKFWNQERHFGFICFSSSNSDHFDREVYFDDAELHCPVDKGHRVEFRVANHDGTDRAVEINLIEDRLTGTIIHDGKRYGFIEVDERFGDNQRIFFSHSDTIPDVVGRRAMPIGTRVSFAVEMKDGKERAFDVQNEDPSLSQIDPISYREYGQIYWFSDDRGYVTRPNGDSLIFLTKNVVSEGVETIKQGTWLHYSIDRGVFIFDKESRKFRHRVYAKSISVCLEDENSQPMLPIEQAPPGSIEAQFLAAEILPLSEPTNHPARLWTTEEMKLPLREIIRRRRAA